MGRAKRYGVRFYTVRRSDEIEAWLDHNCRAGWDLSLYRLKEGPDGIRKELLVSFDSENDCCRFQRSLGRV